MIQVGIVNFQVLVRYKPFYAEAAGQDINWAPAIAWLVTLAICVLAVRLGYIQIYFASLPGWFIAALLYIAACKVVQTRTQAAGRATT